MFSFYSLTGYLHHSIKLVTLSYNEINVYEKALVSNISEVFLRNKFPRFMKPALFV